MKQLLHLMIHSLYSNQEIFLRELISNASDAADKLRFEALSDASLLDDDTDLRIELIPNSDEGTLTIVDNGIGMSRDEVIDNLGTIARSGTAAFLEQMSGDESNAAQLIGQFGVGFYSAFIVADRVEVVTRRAGTDEDSGTHWESAGAGEFHVDSCTAPRGTRVVLHLKKAEAEFSDPYRLRALVQKYSDHIAFPVVLTTMVKPDDESDSAAPAELKQETVNSATALWTRSRSEIEDEEYIEFYKYLSHDFEDPLKWSHNRVEGKRDYTSLLYLPARAMFDLWNRESPRGLKLYVQRVFIMDNAEQFLPLYLRFVRGIVDSSDLPLNVSRELLQSHPELDAMKSALTRRALDMLAKMAKGEEETYQTFWNEFGEVLKEGLAEDFANKDRIAALLRFSTTASDSDEASRSLDAYIEAMPEDQKFVYYLTADSLTSARTSPHLEVLRKNNTEVLLLTHRLDDWMIGHLSEYEGKALKDISRGDLELPGAGGEITQDALDKEHKGLLKKIKRVLKDQVEAVKVSQRLVDSPACLVTGKDDLGPQMRRLLEASGQQVPESKPIFEINPGHPLVERLADEANDSRFEDLALVLMDQARLGEGEQLPDPGAYVGRINKLLLELSA